MLINSCYTNKGLNENTLLLADREAPLGWVYLKIYNDSTFEFITTGLRNKNVYPGKVIITEDTLYFNYRDKIPKAGNKAIINNKIVIYTEGEYSERLEIEKNEIQ